jgi:hypothetical protein
VGGPRYEGPAVGREVEKEHRSMAVVRLERDLLWWELPDELDVLIDAAKVLLHDLWDKK